MSVERIVSGGQTGVDRAALDVALEFGLRRGGWCPRGRRAEDGRIPRHYPLNETTSDRYAQRTAWNVRDSDGTLILTRGAPTGGTALTLRIARSLGRPVWVVDLARTRAVVPLARWLKEHHIRTLNVAGPRESSCPGVGVAAAKFLRRLTEYVATSVPG